MSHPKEILRRIPEGKEVLLTVTELDVCAENFPGKNTKTTYCHFFMAQYSEFPEPEPFQWCVQKDQVEFKVGDTIKVKAGTYADTKKRQSVTFIEKASPVGHREIMKKIAETPTTFYEPKHRPVNNHNPAVMGSLWSIALGHAIQFNKDKKNVTMVDVLLDAALLEADYNNRFTQVQ